MHFTARPKSGPPGAKVLFALGALLGTALLSPATASWALDDGATITIGDTPLSLAQLQAGVAMCRRDAPELPLRRCVEDFIVPLHRLDREVTRRNLRDTTQGRRRTAGVLTEALYVSVQRGITIADADVKAYLDQHQREFRKPQRLRLFRILVDTEEDAARVLAQVGPDTTPTAFRALCRSHSKDPATRERGGDLGFVWPDGTTDVPQLRAEASLYQAALAVPDGAFVPKPVPERTQFAVVWRRGSLTEVNVTPSDAEGFARERVLERRTREALDALVAAAKTTVHPEPLGLLQRQECRIFKH